MSDEREKLGGGDEGAEVEQLEEDFEGHQLEAGQLEEGSLEVGQLEEGSLEVGQLEE